MFKSIIIYVFTFLLILSCSQQIRYQKTSYFDLVDKNMAKQKKGDITVELFPLTDNEYKKSFYTQKIEVYDISVLSESGMKEKPFPIQYYNGLTAFKVNIINNTDHIIRMRDARIAFIDPDSDEPIMTLSKSEVLEDPASYFPYYNQLRAYILQWYFKTDPNYLDASLTKAFKRITKKLKFINGFNKEILPGMKSSGIILFPITPEQASEGKISFIDLVSKTDKAGNPIKKVRMDFAIKVIYKYWKYDPNLKKWVKINKSEYEKGNNS